MSAKKAAHLTDLRQQLAPIVIFVYNRPEHTRRMLDSLALAEGAEISRVFVFSDGPSRVEEEDNVLKVRALLKNENRFGSIHITESKQNKGLAVSIISGVSKVLEEFEKVIVLEDDLVVTKGFLTYLNAQLNRLSTEKDVWAVSGYSFFSSTYMPQYYGLKVMSSWGWATWRSRWEKMEWNAEILQRNIESTKVKRFDFAGFSYTKLLKNQVDGKIDSWAIRFYANLVLNNGVCIYPAQSLVVNEGFDGTGTHKSTASIWTEPVADNYFGKLPFKWQKEYLPLRLLIEKHIKNKKAKFVV